MVRFLPTLQQTSTSDESSWMTRLRRLRFGLASLAILGCLFIFSGVYNSSLG